MKLNTFDLPKVINGVGDPTIIIQENEYRFISTSNTIITATSITYAPGLPDDILDGMFAHCFMMDGRKTIGLITERVSSTELTIEEWDNGTPENETPFLIKDIRLDLPTAVITETYTPEYIVHKNQFGKREVIRRGYDYSAVVDYSQLAYGGLIRGVGSALSMNPDVDMQLVLIPYRDEMRVQRPVYLVGDINFSKLAQRHGHLNFKLEFEGNERYPDIPTYGTGWGFLWSTSWGNHTF